MLPNIYLYVDYRQFLYDLYCAFRCRNRRFSSRGFGRLAGWRSGDFIKDLLDRKIDIDPSTISHIAQRLRLNDNQREYFETIVSFDQAKSHDEKDRYFRTIIYKREYGPVKELEKRQYEYFAHWYNPVIRELVTHPDYPDDPSWLAERMVPRVDPGQITQAIELLESMGFIRHEPSGKWVQTDRVVSTPSEVMSLAVNRYHQDVIAMGKKALQEFSPQQRDMRSITMGISHEAFYDVKKRIEAFWKELLQFANTQERVEQVYQVNIQLFPMSKANKDTQ